MFRDAKVGDRVWSTIKGWAIVVSITGGVTYPITVRYEDGGTDTYMEDGRWRKDHPFPILFWDEVKIIPPPKPKRKVRKVVEGCLSYSFDKRIGTIGNVCFLNEGGLNPIQRSGPDIIHVYQPIRHEYETKED